MKIFFRFIIICISIIFIICDFNLYDFKTLIFIIFIVNRNNIFINNICNNKQKILIISSKYN